LKRIALGDGVCVFLAAAGHNPTKLLFNGTALCGVGFVICQKQVSAWRSHKICKSKAKQEMELECSISDSSISDSSISDSSISDSSISNSSISSHKICKSKGKNKRWNWNAASATAAASAAAASATAAATRQFKSYCTQIFCSGVLILKVM